MKFNAKLTCTAFNKTQLPDVKYTEVAFVGRSNVGKSTLINVLLGRRLAKVSSQPGKTRSINFYEVEADNLTFNLVDLPGYGFASRGHSERKEWQKLIDSYFTSIRPISFVVQLIDFRHGMLENDYLMCKYLKSIDVPSLVVFTKADKIAKTKRKANYDKLASECLFSIVPPIITSGDQTLNIDELRSTLLQVIKRLKCI